MRCLLVLLLCGSANLAHAKGGTTSATSPTSSTSSTSRSRNEAAIGYRIFGAHLGATLGSAAAAAAFATGNEAAPAATGLVAVPMTMASLHTMGRFARDNEWNPRVGSALAGMHPGFAYGALTGFMIADQAGLEGRARRGAILGFGAALSAITMGVWSRIIGRNLKKAMGMMYVLALAGSLLISPYAAVAEKPRALGWALVATGAISLTIASFNTEF